MRLLVHAENTTFRVWKGDAQYNLRIHRPGYQTPEAIRSELQYLAALHTQTDVIAPDPVPALDGELMLPAEAPGLEEPRTVVLFHWIDGEFQRKLTTRHAFQVGELMAKVQQFGRDFRRPAGFSRRRLDFDGELGREIFASLQPGARLVTEEERLFLLEEAEAGRNMMRELGQAADTYGLIHADFHQGNVLWQGNRIAAIDFDDLGYAHYLYDFASALAYTLRSENYLDICEHMLAGFQSAHPLPPRTMELLPAFLRVRFLGLVSWFILRSDSPKMSATAPAMIERCMSRIKLLHEPWGSAKFI